MGGYAESVPHVYAARLSSASQAERLSRAIEAERHTGPQRCIRTATPAATHWMPTIRAAVTRPASLQPGARQTTPLSQGVDWCPLTMVYRLASRHTWLRSSQKADFAARTHRHIRHWRMIAGGLRRNLVAHEPFSARVILVVLTPRPSAAGRFRLRGVPVYAASRVRTHSMTSESRQAIRLVVSFTGRGKSPTAGASRRTPATARRCWQPPASRSAGRQAARLRSFCRSYAASLVPAVTGVDNLSLGTSFKRRHGHSGAISRGACPPMRERDDERST